MTKYPAQIDTSASLPNVVDNLTPVTGTVVNRLRDAIVAIEVELGVHPANGSGTVAARLDHIESIIGSSGHGISLAGDLGNTVDLPYVIGLRGRPLSTATPTINDVLLWDGVSWSPEPYINNGLASGDLSGHYPNPIVSAWLGLTLDGATMGAPADGQVPVWHAGSSSWKASTNMISSSGVSPGTAGQTFITSAGLVSVWDSTISVNSGLLVTISSGLTVSSTVTLSSLSGAGTGYIQLDSSGVLSRVSNIPTGVVSPGTAGQVLITNSTPATSWTSLVSVETTHGRFTSGGNGSDYSVVIGPRVGGETTDGMIWILPNSISPNGLNNFAIDANGTSLVLNAISGSGSIYFGAAGTNVANIEGTHGRFTAGGNGTDAKTIIGPVTGIETEAAIYLLPNATSLSSTNWIAKTDATFTYYSDTFGNGMYFYSGGSTQLGHWSSTGFYTSVPINLEGLIPATSGDIRATNNTTIIAARNAGNTANFNVVATNNLDQVLIGDTSGTSVATLISGGNGTSFVHVDSGSYVQIHGASTIYSDTANQLWRDAGAGTTISWAFNSAGATSATIAAGVTGFTLSQAQATVGAGNTITIKAQDAFATSGLGGGSLQLFYGAGDGLGAPGETIIGQSISSGVQIRLGNKGGGSDASFSGIFFLPAATASSSSNFSFLGNGSDVYLNAPTGTIYLKIGNSTAVAQATSSRFDVYLPLLFTNLAGAGTGYIQLDTSGNLSRVTTVPASGFTPGTAGQVLITNSTPSAVWTSLIDVELTHGRFTSGGTGTDFATVIGPMVGFETSFAAIYLLPNATSPSTSNWTLRANASNLQLQGLSDSTSIQFATPTYFLETLSTAGVSWSFDAGTTVASIEHTHGRLTSGGGGLSDFAVIIGPMPSFETADAGIWFLPHGTSPTSVNVGVYGDGTSTYINVPNNAGNFDLVWQGATIPYQFSRVGTITWSNATAPTLLQGILGTDVATADFLITPQAPYTSAVINLSPGNFIVRTPTPLATANFFGGFLWERGDATAGMRLGYYGGPDTTYTGIWFNDAAAPTTSNFAFLGNQSFTYLNVPSAGSLVLSVGGSASSGKTFNFIGGSSWAETLGASVAAYSLVVPGGYIALESNSSMYLDGSPLYMRDSAHNSVITWSLLHASTTSATLDAAVTGFTLTQTAVASDIVPADINIAPQPAFASAVTNVVSGNFNINFTQTTTPAGQVSPFLNVTLNTIPVVRIGPYGGGAYGSIWFNQSSPNSTNWSFLGNSADTYFNAPSNNMYFGITASYFMHMTSSAFTLGTSYVTPQYQFDFSATAVQHFTANATSATIKYDQSTTGAGATFSIKGQDALAASVTAGGNISIEAGLGDGAASNGAINIGTATTKTNIGIGNAVGGSASIGGNPVYISSFGGGNGLFIYATAISCDWNGSLGEFVNSVDLNDFLFHRTATTPKLWQQIPTSDVATVNLTIQAQGPYASAVTNLTAADTIVNVPASVGAGVKYGGFQVQYGSAASVAMGSYNNNSYSAIWLAQSSFSSTNYTLLSNNSGYTALNAGGGGTLHFAISNVDKATLTTALFNVIVPADLGASTGTNLLRGALQETTRTASASFTLDTTTTDRDVFVTATLTLTLDTTAHAGGRKVTIWIDTTSTGSSGSDITLTIAPAATEKINGTNANWSITVPGSPAQIQRLEMVGDGTNIRIA